MKKILAIVFVLMLLVLVVGCAKTSQVEDKSQEQTSDEISDAEQELNDLNSDEVDSVEKDLEDFNW